MLFRKRRKKSLWFGISVFDSADLLGNSFLVGAAFPAFNYVPDEGDGDGGGGESDDNDSGDDNDDNTKDDQASDDDSDDEDETVPRSELNKVVQETIKRKKTIEKLRAEKKAMEAKILSDEDQTAYDEWKQQQADDDQNTKKKKGEYETIIQEQKSASDKTIAERDATIEELQIKLANTNVKNTLATLLPGLTNKDTPIDDVIGLIQSNFRYDVEAEKVVVIDPEDPEGDPPLSIDGINEMGPEEFIQKWIEKRPLYAPTDKPIGSGGKNQKGSGRKGSYTRNDIGSMNQADYRKQRDKVKGQVS